jgi:hypothetical protein
MDTDAQLAQYFAGVWPHLDEHARRLVAASQAVELGYGGISRVSRACGLSRVTLTKGVEELQAAPLAAGRIRHEGGGRHALTSKDPGLAPALDGMVAPTSRGVGVTHVLSTILVGVSPTDPLIFGVVAALLLAFAILGCTIPARRAMRVDPAIALRHE